MTTYSDNLKKELLDLARKTISAEFNGESVDIPITLKESSLSTEKNGVFVTLKKRGDLRGCIGTIIGTKPFLESMKEMALQSSFHDPRFPALTQEELEETEIEISILTVPHKVKSWKDITIGQDGIILNCNHRSALFLPQVATEQNWDIETTLSHLSLKAGLSPEIWKSEQCEFSVFQATYFNESEVL